MRPVRTPEPPYYAVIFTSTRTENDADGYAVMAENMRALAEQQEGFLGMESARNALGITVSYWKTPEAIRNWKNHAEHTLARQAGREKWYASFTVRIARVEKEYSFTKDT